MLRQMISVGHNVQEILLAGHEFLNREERSRYILALLELVSPCSVTACYWRRGERCM